jgi:hypothetical protein
MNDRKYYRKATISSDFQNNLGVPGSQHVDEPLDKWNSCRQGKYSSVLKNMSRYTCILNDLVGAPTEIIS